MVVALGLQALPSANRRALIVVAAGVLIGWQVADSQLERYLRWPTGRPASGTNPNVVLVVALFLGIAIVATRGKQPTAWTMPVLSLAMAGAYLCVPETGTLVLLVLPLAVAAAGVSSRRLLQPSALAVVLLAGLVAWIVVVDGQTRWASTIGALGCFAALLLARPRPNQRSIWSATLADLPARRIDRMQAAVDVVVVVATIAVCSRVAGISASTKAATGIVIVTLAIAWAVRTTSDRLFYRTGRSSATASEELQCSQRKVDGG